jgi:hypothetical protein
MTGRRETARNLPPRTECLPKLRLVQPVHLRITGVVPRIHPPVDI